MSIVLILCFDLFELHATCKNQNRKKLQKIGINLNIKNLKPQQKEKKSDSTRPDAVILFPHLALKKYFQYN